MATSSVPNVFVNDTPADATEVNANFTSLVNFSNNSVVHVDGSKEMTASFDAGGHRVVNVGTATASTDAVTKSQLDAAVTGITPYSEPAGIVRMTAKADASTGWLLCQGQAVSRVTYALLFAAIGTAYGAGDGVNTFNLPDFRDAFPVGVSASKVRGASGGSADAVVVSHGHSVSVSGGSHEHTYVKNTGTSGATSGAAVNSLIGNGNQSTSGGGSHSHTASAGTAGVSGTNANLPPYRAINFEIRTGL